MKLICIDDTIPHNRLIEISLHYPNWIKKGQPYTVRRLDTVRVGGKEEHRVLLEEVINPLRDDILKGYLVEPGFSLKRFRELVPDEPLQLEEPSINEMEVLI